jgi:ketosteroid isomerase-like protein
MICMTTRRYRTAELCVIAILLSGSMPFAQLARTPEQQVLQADTDRFTAMVQGDLARLDKLLAIELTYIHSSARLEDKHAFMYGIKSAGTKYLKIIPTERQVHVMGNVAVVTGVAALHVVDRGQDFDITIRYTNVHVLRDGRWQMVSWQATRLVPTDKVIPGGPA